MAVSIKSLGSVQLGLLALAFLGLYLVSVAVYRLYFSPLAKFPGPKLAALTYGVELYHDVLRRGRYMFEIAKMHEKYGPIVRIAPHELHIDDPTFADELYPGAHKVTERPQYAAEASGNSMSVLSTVPHNLHKMRRSALNPFFSKRSVTEYAGSMQACVDRMCANFDEYHTSQKPINLFHAYSALTADVLTLFTFGRSWGSLGKPDFDPELFNGIASGGELRLLLKRFPWIFKLMALLPSSITVRLNRNASNMIERRKEIETQVQTLLSGESKSVKQAGQTPNIFETLIESDGPAEERSMKRLVDEGIILIGAGTVTTAHALATVTYHVLANPAVLETLQKELQDAMPDGADIPPQTLLVRLEHLPYLTACITEGLRLAHAISHRNLRVAPDRSLKFQDWTIPPGTATGMSAYMVHLNPTFFPAPQEFRPERWLEGDVGRVKRVYMPFGKGNRICMGMNLAYSELYMTLAAVFRRFDMKLFETTREDVDVVHDFTVGMPRLDSKGMRVVVHKRDT